MISRQMVENNHTGYYVKCDRQRIYWDIGKNRISFCSEDQRQEMTPENSDKQIHSGSQNRSRSQNPVKIFVWVAVRSHIAADKRNNKRTQHRSEEKYHFPDQ